MDDVKKNREELKWHIEKNEWEKLQYSRFSSNYWYLAKTIVDKAVVPGFIDILVIFIKQEQTKAKEVDNAKDKQCKEVNSS